ncbi:SEC-C metal-binding domain-containing protein [Pontiella sulfatireligans]|uniref:Uncharacterized protein n=1 Tax=Pontiella sulfatireligans TaxID=2750658 RepID=A0A6C2UW42_9BACT|nr:SEC-C metal-binding domain-containing protein [Pontiella sulfatireligans]VGO23056.1 hypothetical protein SCARR_05155 [Pontiella sulfatireligans]
MKLTPELIQKLAQTTFCRPAIAELAELFENTTTEEVNALAFQLTEQGEDVALDRLLTTCAFCDIQLDPTILAESAAVIYDLTHLPYSYANQGAEAIEPLIKNARAEMLSHERQALLGRLATELALRHQSRHDEVARLLQYLQEEIRTPPVSMMVYDSIHMLELGELKEGAFPLMTEFDIHESLPERPPPRVIGNGETIRRPIPKLGRNEPCHCGSGKKYKRCCLEKDQAILADASSYEGVTQSQLAENPGVVDDEEVIYGLRAYEIKKLTPERLTTNQLLPAYHKACTFGLSEVAFAMLVERSKRSDSTWPFDKGNFVDFMEYALAHNDIEMAQRARVLVPQDSELVNWDEIDFQFDLCTNPGHLETIEARCQKAFCCLPDETGGFRDHEFCNLAHLFFNKFPALSILFARAALLECPDRVLDNELLVECVHQARIDLGLSPWDDPVDTWLDDYDNEQADRTLDKELARETEALRKQLAESREKIREAETGLSSKEALLAELKNELDATAGQQKICQTIPEKPKKETQEAAQDTVNRLRRQIDSLKAEIGNQQEKWQQLRHELDRERQHAQRASATQKPTSENTENEDAAAPAMPGENARTIVVPDYHGNFRDACRSVPGSAVASAVKAIASFAVYDPAVWRNARSIKQLANIYRVRIGRNYRLLLRWVPGQSLTVLDLIPRQDLESWIRRHA